uniref:Retrovirus-related Pol polyprotein from transposon TNT 1-94 n=1 Tax=Tanacetum cinerariifolium TaxID=118510 RepID=A0A6L2MLG8_TANCI|nr:retrovirus-related Pol polyprotein from transposon TNT 1-94 [Tanacetum cinerariifolium]
MEEGIFFNQSKYIKEMLKKFGLEDSRLTKTPMSTKIKLTKHDEPNSIDSSKYQGSWYVSWKKRKKTRRIEA